MIDREKVIKGLDICTNGGGCKDGIPNPLCPYSSVVGCDLNQILLDALVLLKEQESLLGIQQTADSITFISTGTAQQGEARGLLLGKFAMHEWLEKELLYRGLLTDDIRAVFDEAKRKGDNPAVEVDEDEVN